MKVIKIISAIIGLVVITSESLAATWTFHGWKDNFVNVTLGPTFAGFPYHRVDFWFDYAWDEALPGQADSGIGYSVNLDPSTWMMESEVVVPQAELLSAETPDDWWLTSFYVCQGYPDYNGSWSGIQEPTLVAGEYWIDFASDGSYRINSTQPDDFGKWAWDGSINPNWVESLAVAEHGKRLAKGHAK